MQHSMMSPVSVDHSTIVWGNAVRPELLLRFQDMATSYKSTYTCTCMLTKQFQSASAVQVKPRRENGRAHLSRRISSGTRRYPLPVLKDYKTYWILKPIEQSEDTVGVVRQVGCRVLEFWPGYGVFALHQIQASCGLKPSLLLLIRQQLLIFFS